MKVAIGVLSMMVLAMAFTFAADGGKKERPKAEGTVKAVDAEKKTVTVTVADKDEVFTVNEKTKVLAGREVKKLEDLKAGDKVVVMFSEEGGTKTALRIMLAPANAKN